jgi:hypothetical protein
LVAPGRLRAKERGVGLLEQLLDRDLLPRAEGRDPGAERQHTSGSAGDIRDGQRLHRRADAFDGDPRGLQALLRQHQHELLPAVAVDAVARSDLPGEPGGHCPQCLVTGPVPEGVVDGLEAVEVADGHAVATAVALAASVQDPQILLQRAAVAQLGQGVGASQQDQLSAGAGQGGVQSGHPLRSDQP